MGVLCYDIPKRLVAGIFLMKWTLELALHWTELYHVGVPCHEYEGSDSSISGHDREF